MTTSTKGPNANDERTITNDPKNNWHNPKGHFSINAIIHYGYFFRFIQVLPMIRIVRLNDILCPLEEMSKLTPFLAHNHDENNCNKA